MNTSISIKEICGWIAGFWDGEGSVMIRTTCNGEKHHSYYLSVGNTDIELMNRCSDYLNKLGIEHTKFEVREHPPRKAFYTFHVCKADSIRKFAEMIHMGSPLKVEKLNKIVSWIDRPMYIERFAIEHEQELKSLYPEHTIRCIVDRLGLKQGSHPRVTMALKQLGLWKPKQHQGVACRCRRG